VTYSVTPATGGNQLSKVYYSTSRQTSQSYITETQSFPFAFTGIIDENGNQYNT
jgi:hypothetical protein